MFVEIVENGMTNTEKLLICLMIILFLTIVWTILIGIMCKMREGTTVVKKTNRFLLDEDDDDDKVVVKKTSKKTTKKTTKKKTTTKKAKKTTKKKTSKTSTKAAAKTTNSIVTAGSNQEVYVRVRFYGTEKNLIYVAPENIILRKGEKIKVRTDEGNIRTATVVEGNYLRDKYKTYEYQTLDLVEESK